jgi:spermidine/putrescine transport system substrate-binding protein
MTDPFARPMRRREVLRAGAGATLGLSGLGALAGCGVSRNQGASTQAPQKVVKAQPDGDLVYFNWSEYLDPELIEAFEKRYSVRVRESNFDSMQGMMAKLRAGNRYDLIFPSSEWADRLIKANQLLRIDQEQLSNLGNQIYSPFKSPWYDPQASYTIPYALYATGLIYRADKLDSMTGSWNDLKNPDAKNRTYLLDDFQEAIGAGNLVNGFQLNSVEEAQVEKSEEWLLGVKPNLRGISTDDITNMTSGNAWIHHGWNGDVVNIRNQVKKPENYKFAGSPADTLPPRPATPDNHGGCGRSRDGCARKVSPRCPENGRGGLVRDRSVRRRRTSERLSLRAAAGSPTSARVSGSQRFEPSIAHL